MIRTIVWHFLSLKEAAADAIDKRLTKLRDTPSNKTLKGKLRNHYIFATNGQPGLNAYVCFEAYHAIFKDSRNRTLDLYAEAFRHHKVLQLRVGGGGRELPKIMQFVLFKLEIAILGKPINNINGYF